MIRCLRNFSPMVVASTSILPRSTGTTIRPVRGLSPSSRISKPCFRSMAFRTCRSGIPNGAWRRPPLITDPTAQEAYVSTGLILQAALGVQTEIFYAYDNANSSLYNIATGQLTPAGVAYEQTEQWLTGATLTVRVSTERVGIHGPTDQERPERLIVWNSAGQSTYSTGAYTQYVDAKVRSTPL